MSYAILFPYGQPGWNPRWDSLPYPEALPDGEEPIRKHHSMLQYFSALLQVRNNEFWPPIVNAGNLFQQYIVDAYLRKESNDLSWVRLNQNKILAENYTGANNFIQREAQKQGKNSAPAIILPSSFTGSPRNMRQLSEDCLAIFSQMGKPDLFITFTCNPKWKDITDNIVHGETASDRPDITNRVFKIKLDEMIKEIEAGLFGPVVAYVYTIEFQKRGLPHAHILITLQSGYKPKDPASIDKIVCAEIPDKTENPKLYDIITKVMIHGPCRVGLCKDSDDAFCKKGFPKPFLSETQTINNNYPKYKRRQHPAITIQRGNQFMETNNRYVVPYNPYLSLKYDAHINVEIVANMQGAIKYIYKYIFKGYDTASLIVTVNGEVSVDEIKTYIGCRYVSPPEAHWRLFAFQMHDRSHAVIRLPVHLRSLDAEDLMDVPMDEEAIPANNIGITTLTRFFMMNQDPNSPTRTLLYTEMPFFYTWEGRTKMWNHRQQGGDKIVVRMYNVNPAACEKFATRMLLATVRGPQSFEDLYTVNGVLHPTAIAAAQALNLIRNDDVYIQTFNELVQKGMPHQLRRFFASMVMSLTISDALPFWNMYKEHFIEDFRRDPRNVNCSEDDLYNLALQVLNNCFGYYGKRNSTYSLPMPRDTPAVLPDQPILTQQPLNITLNPAQQQGFDRVMSAVQSIRTRVHHQKLFVVIGPGGSGKTTLYKKIIEECQQLGFIAKVFATTGIAATLMPGGLTAHSGFGFPLNMNSEASSRLERDLTCQKSRELASASVIMVDEITMMNKHGLRIMDSLLRKLTSSNELFGGKVIIFGGDFRQLLPVVPGGKREHIIAECVISSPLWKHFEVITLSQNMRAQGDTGYSDWLLKLGTGSHDRPMPTDPCFVEIPIEMVLQIPPPPPPPARGNIVNLNEMPHELKTMINKVFGQDISALTPEQLASRAILASTVKQVTKVNDFIIGSLAGEAKTYLSADRVISDEEDDAINFPVEQLNKEQPSGMPPHKITLKVGVVIMLLRNLSPENGLSNGTRLIVEKLYEHSIVGKIISESHRGELAIIARMDMVSDDKSMVVTMLRHQLPIIPAYAMTINKSQGQTIERVGILLNDVVFSHGQLYVCLLYTSDAADE